MTTIITGTCDVPPPEPDPDVFEEIRLARRHPTRLLNRITGRRSRGWFVSDAKWEQELVANRDGTVGLRYRVTIVWRRLAEPELPVSRRWLDWTRPRLTWSEWAGLLWFRLRSRRAGR